MKIKFLGAAGTVTGSSYVLTSATGDSLLIDLGMFQGVAAIDKLNFLPYDYDCSQLTGAILTHAHLDHCGRLPILLPRGYKGKIWMTPATADLTELSLIDSAKINREGPNKSLYDKDLAENTIQRFHTIGYRTPFEIGDFKITMRDAGHILGSAFLEIEDTQANSEIRKIVFSGDLGNSPEDLLNETELVDEADAVVMESTYGDRLHSAREPADVVMSEINAVENSGGTLLIPAFALERTQELLHIIMHLKRDAKIKADTPVFLDSPMAMKATDIYMSHREVFNEHIHQDFDHESIFGFPGLEILERRDDSKLVYKMSGPKVFIAGAGMMTGGRIVSHAAHFLGKESTRLLLVGYQGEETLGRDLMEGEKVVTIEKTTVQVKASITSTDAMSSHADQSQLMKWIGHIKGIKKVILTHGDDGPRKALAGKIEAELSVHDISLPTLNQEIQL